MVKTKEVKTKKASKTKAIITEEGLPGFDWATYSQIDFRKRPHDKAFLAELEQYTLTLPTDKRASVNKEDRYGSMMTIQKISPVKILTDLSENWHIIVKCTTTSGYTFNVDLIKDHSLIDYFYEDKWSFDNAIDFYNNCNETYQREILESRIPVMFKNHQVPDIKSGIKESIRRDLYAEFKLPTYKKTLYNGVIVSTNNGGFNVEIKELNGYECFLPLSHSGIMVKRRKGVDFTELLDDYIGTEVQVVPSGPGQDGTVIVSNREYTKMCIERSREKLIPSDDVTYKGTITGVTYFGIFVESEVPLEDGNTPLKFSGLIHTTVMSDDLYREFLAGNVYVGETIHTYINNITDDGKFNMSDLKQDEAVIMAAKREAEKEEAKAAESEE